MDFSKLNTEFSNIQIRLEKYNNQLNIVNNEIKKIEKELSKLETKIKQSKIPTEELHYKLKYEYKKEQLNFLKETFEVKEIKDDKTNANILEK